VRRAEHRQPAAAAGTAAAAAAAAAAGNYNFSHRDIEYW
jgi:hypothetical protein